MKPELKKLLLLNLPYLLFVYLFAKSYREFIECTAITRTTSIISDKICLLKSFGNIYICQVILFK